MTPAERAEARRLAGAATGGIWEVHGTDDDCEITADIDDLCPDAIAHGLYHHDAAFIAASRALVPQLLDEMDRVSDEYQQWITELEGPTPRELLERLTTAESQLAAASAELDDARDTVTCTSHKTIAAEAERYKLSAELALLRQIYDADTAARHEVEVERDSLAARVEAMVDALQAAQSFIECSASATGVPLDRLRTQVSGALAADEKELRDGK